MEITRLNCDLTSIIMQLQTATSRFYSERWSLLIQDLWRISQIIAIIFGGIWAYSKFIKGRIYKPRLESKINGEIKKAGNIHYLKIDICLKNVGLSRLTIIQKGTGLYIKVAKNNKKIRNLDSHNINWEIIDAISILEDHKWIESNETVTEEQLIKIILPKDLEDVQSDYIAIQIQTQIISGNRLNQDNQWNNKKVLWL